VIRVAAEFEYVPLRDAHVLKQLPGSVGNLLDLPIDQLQGEILNDALEIYVRASAFEQVEKMLAQCLIIIHTMFPSLSRFLKRAEAAFASALADHLPERNLLWLGQHSFRPLVEAERMSGLKMFL
jgi:hypothetical protein